MGSDRSIWMGHGSGIRVLPSLGNGLAFDIYLVSVTRLGMVDMSFPGHEIHHRLGTHRAYDSAEP